ncbi:glycosyltransferase [Polaribacter sp. WD7]|uniref:glycosyltransferase family 2 protein n=1 Tax=Polaribacter sp. WD7 TaxID=2269061 RepID=UPI000DF239E2|nr:glycosyltransferase family 2 protein [Polaribacter sp. WD7]RCS26238.1 glycosyltransferase [Polaribacter sp. WD7]
MLLSIITATFNSEKTLSKTIESLLSQKTTNFEYIIVDGNSTDKTTEIIKSFEKKFEERNINYVWISEKDKGIYDAFNKGIDLASGDWISFLGSDDFYLKDALKNYCEQIKKLTGHIDLIHSKVKLADRKIISDTWCWRSFRRRMLIAHVGAFHHRNFFTTYGNFDTSYRITGDYEILLRAKDKLKTYWFDKFTAYMSDGGVSNGNIKMVYREAARAKRENKSVSSFLVTYDYYFWILKFKIKRMLNAATR